MTENEGREKLAAVLSQLLADTLVLYVKTHGFHWNVTGRMFHSLHLMFENQYKELWLAADALGKRIRALDFPAPGSYRELSKLTQITETQGIPSAAGMIAELLSDHDSCARAARRALWIARSSIDAATEDLLTRRLEAHEQSVWMLKSLLADDTPVTMRQVA